MSLWRQTPNLDQLNATLHNTIGEQLDIRLSGEDAKSAASRG